MLTLARVGREDYIIDLGSGDGRIVVAAAQQFGARGLGLDVDARLVALSRKYSEQAGVAELTDFEVRDVLAADLSRATVVTMYLLPWLVERLQPKLLEELAPGTRIIAHAFPMQGWKPDRTETVRILRRHPGQGDESRLFLWVVPAKARGVWQAGPWELRVQQNFQEIEVDALSEGRSLALTAAKLEGASIAFSGAEVEFSGRIDGAAITGKLTHAGSEQTITFQRR